MDLTTPAGIDTYLRSTQFNQYQDAQRLSEGFSGFVFRVHLRDSDASSSVPRSLIIKHVEGYAARSTSWKLDQSRLEIECKALQLLSQPEFKIEGIRPPKVHHFDKASWVLVLEDAGDVPSLKGWMRPGAVGMDEDVKNVGTRIGNFLARVHNVTSRDPLVLQQFDGNETGKYLSSTLYFKNLPDAAAKFGHTDECFQQAAHQGQSDILGASEVLTLGDFWTGNVLVSKDLDLFVLDLELAKPGTADFDIGQMAAEIYCIAAFRDRESGMALLHSFMESYRSERHEEVDVAKVAVRIGAHLIIIAPTAWRSEASESQIKDQVDVGAELIRLGIAGDDEALKDTVVEKLYP